MHPRHESMNCIQWWGCKKPPYCKSPDNLRTYASSRYTSYVYLRWGKKEKELGKVTGIGLLHMLVTLGCISPSQSPPTYSVIHPETSSILFPEKVPQNFIRTSRAPATICCNGSAWWHCATFHNVVKHSVLLKLKPIGVGCRRALLNSHTSSRERIVVDYVSFP